MNLAKANLVANLALLQSLQNNNGSLDMNWVIVQLGRKYGLHFNEVRSLVRQMESERLVTWSKGMVRLTEYGADVLENGE